MPFDVGDTDHRMEHLVVAHTHGEQSLLAHFEIIIIRVIKGHAWYVFHFLSPTKHGHEDTAKVL